MTSDLCSHSIVSSESSSSLSEIINDHPEIKLSWSDINVTTRHEISWIGWLLREQSKVQTRLLNDVSGSVEPGQVLGLIGASSVGKTTLLKALSGQDDSQTIVKGECFLNDRLTTRLQRLKGTIMGYVDEYETFSDTTTVEEHLTFNAMLKLKISINNQERRKRACIAMKLLSLDESAHTMIKDLSNGQRKRLGIATIFLTNPSIMLIDEPVCDLDSHTAKGIIQMIRTLAVDYHRTIIIAVRRPTSHILAALDSLCLLVRGGNQAFFGDKNQALTFFTQKLDLSASSLEKYIEQLMEITETEEETSNCSSSAKLCFDALRNDETIKKWSIEEASDEKA